MLRVRDRDTDRFNYYDSRNSGLYAAKLENITSHVAATGTTGLVVRRSSMPLQFDEHSCGIFVCVKLWHFVDDYVSSDMSTKGLNAPRARLARFVLSPAMNTEV